MNVHGRFATGSQQPMRVDGFGLAVVLVLALSVRLVLLVSLRRSVYGDFLLWDERTYEAWAEALVPQSSDVGDQSLEHPA